MLGLYKSICCGSASRFNPQHTSQKRYIVESRSGATAGVGVLNDRNGCWAAMEGTHTTQQWLLNADFVAVPFRSKTCAGCKVDMGFFTNYEATSKQIFNALSEFGCKGKPLYLVGHSLGAAGLHYLMYDAIEDGYTVQYMYAMETPRPGNKEFAEAMLKKAQGVSAWRISHHYDIVVQVPPPKVLGYSHALFEIFYDTTSGTHYKVCTALESVGCSLMYAAMPWKLTWTEHCWYAGRNPCGCGSLSVEMDAESNSTFSTELLV